MCSTSTSVSSPLTTAATGGASGPRWRSRSRTVPTMPSLSSRSSAWRRRSSSATPWAARSRSWCGAATPPRPGTRPVCHVGRLPPGADRWAIVRALEELHRTTRLIPRPFRVQGARALLAGFVVDRSLEKDLLDALDRHDPAAVQQAARAVMRFSSTEWIGEVSVPTAVVVTERDRLVPRPGSSTWRRASCCRGRPHRRQPHGLPLAAGCARRRGARGLPLVSAGRHAERPAPTPRWWRRSTPGAATRSGGARGWRRRRRARA